MEFLKINNTLVKSPGSIQSSYESLDSVERTMDGTLVIDEIGKKLSLECKWEYLGKTDMAQLSALVESGAFVSVSYIDKETGSLKTMTARPKDLKYQIQYDWTKDVPLFKGVSISFEER